MSPSLWFSVIAFCLMQLSVNSTQVCSQTENSYLWKVEVDPPVYIFGTLHLPYSILWDTLPGNVKTAFSSSADICLELKFSDSNTVDAFNECQLLPYERTVDNVLAPELIKRIENYFKRIQGLLPSWLDENSQSNFLRGGQSESESVFRSMTHNWRRKRPIWILTLISALTEENIRQRKIPVLDLFIDKAAEGLGKTVEALETVNDQCQPLNRLEDEQVETVLRIQLDYLEALTAGPPGTVDRDRTAYTCGNMQKLIESESILPLPPLSNISNITPEEVAVVEEVELMLYNRLITRRNRRMTKAIDALLKRQRRDVVYIAIGVGHLIGKKSIIDRLRRKDYAIQHLGVNQTIEGPSLPSDIIALGDPGVYRQQSILNLPQQEVEEEEDTQTAWKLPGLSGDALSETISSVWGHRKNRRSTKRETQQAQESGPNPAGRPTANSSAEFAATSCRVPILLALGAFSTLLSLLLLH